MRSGCSLFQTFLCFYTFYFGSLNFSFLRFYFLTSICIYASSLSLIYLLYPYPFFSALLFVRYLRLLLVRLFSPKYALSVQRTNAQYLSNHTNFFRKISKAWIIWMHPRWNLACALLLRSTHGARFGFLLTLPLHFIVRKQNNLQRVAAVAKGNATTKMLENIYVRTGVYPAFE